MHQDEGPRGDRPDAFRGEPPRGGMHQDEVPHGPGTMGEPPHRGPAARSRDMQPPPPAHGGAHPPREDSGEKRGGHEKPKPEDAPPPPH